MPGERGGGNYDGSSRGGHQILDRGQGFVVTRCGAVYRKVGVYRKAKLSLSRVMGRGTVPSREPSRFVVVSTVKDG